MPSFHPISQPTIPRHIAIIMDGNGRWAEQRALHRLEGHHQGSRTLESIVEACREWGVEQLTLYAFSQENWQRPGLEVQGLMELLQAFVTQKRSKLIQHDIRLLTIGKIDQLPDKVLRALTETIRATAHCSTMTLTLALSYSSRSEITDAVNLAIRRAMLTQDPAKILHEEDFDRLLYTEGRTPPDLLIRTSGEYRISNFLLWQMAYTELYFTEKLWPDFTQEDLRDAIEEFQRRERRFGLTTEQLKASS